MSRVNCAGSNLTALGSKEAEMRIIGVDFSSSLSFRNQCIETVTRFPT